MSEIINCKKIDFKYNGVYALKGFDLRVEQGEIVALLGPNGAGKTTSIRVFNGLLVPESGEISVLGFNPRMNGSRIRVQTGVLTETPALYERLTAIENLSFFGTLSGIPDCELEERCKRILDVFNLQQRSRDRVETFSKGMKQRLALARALLNDPALLFLDEPTSDLDPEAAKQVQDLILDISTRGNHTVILCTHRLYEAEKLCDRVAIMRNGTVAAIGTLDELRSQVFPIIRVQICLAVDGIEKLKVLVEKLSGVSSVKMLDRNKLLIDIDNEDRTPAVVSVLVGAGAAIMSVEPRKASLEDIYLHLQHTHKEVES